MNAASEKDFKGRLLRDESMSRHTSWRLGGAADFYFVPGDVEDLKRYLAQLDVDADILWVGLGSNLLVRDGGFRGHVIAPLGALKKIVVEQDGGLYVECGVSCAKLAKVCLKQGFAGGDFFAGIPGTVGGALAMNAGAFGGQTWDVVESVYLIDRRGEVSERPAREFVVGYREVELPSQHWFIGARFRFAMRAEDEESNIRELLRRRNETQPIGLPSCGSVFKNPPGKHAAQLIEAAGLKGFCHGQACVSDKHANFIISNDDTRAAEVEELIEQIQETVAQRFDIHLETEVRIVGERA